MLFSMFGSEPFAPDRDRERKDSGFRGPPESPENPEELAKCLKEIVMRRKYSSACICSLCVAIFYPILLTFAIFYLVFTIY